VVDELTEQVNRCFEEFLAASYKLSQHNFLVNAGGATAVLAYIGSTSDATFAILPLVCFLVGIIACGVELRSLSTFFNVLRQDAIRRRVGFARGEIDLPNAAPPPDLGQPTWVHRVSAFIARWAFPAGVALGMIFYLLSRWPPQAGGPLSICQFLPG
jgi:hypothetical protein